MAGKKVLYFTDDPGSAAVLIAPHVQDDEQRTPSNDKLLRALDAIIFVHVRDFKTQNQIIERLQNTFAPDVDIANSPEFQAFITSSENDLNTSIMDAIRHGHQRPSLVIFDEFTRTYKNHITEKGDPGLANRMLALQAAFLDATAREKNISVIVVSGARVEQMDPEQGLETTSRGDVPAANQIVERYSAIHVHVERTLVSGERIVTITGQGNKYNECISMEDIYNLATGV